MGSQQCSQSMGVGVGTRRPTIVIAAIVVIVILAFCTDMANWSAAGKLKHKGGVSNWLLDSHLSMWSLSYWLQPRSLAVPNPAEQERVNRWVDTIISEDQAHSRKLASCSPAALYSFANQMSAIAPATGSAECSPPVLAAGCTAPKLAYVVPFALHEVDQVILLMRLWSMESYFPCCRCSNTELVLAGANQDAVDEMAVQRKRLESKQGPWRPERCFKAVRILSIDLPAKWDQYGYAPPAMFRTVFGPKMLANFGYTAIFWGEPDTFAVRRCWIDALFQHAISMHHSTLWSLGTSQSFVRSNQNNAHHHLYHLNGNALYKYDSQAFHEFVAHAIPEGLHDAFDTKMFKSRFGSDETPLNQVLALRAHTNMHLLHRFAYSDFVSNHPQDLCMHSLKDFTARWPATHLVHSKAVGALLKCSDCCDRMTDGSFEATKLATGKLLRGMYCLYDFDHLIAGNSLSIKLCEP